MWRSSRTLVLNAGIAVGLGLLAAPLVQAQEMQQEMQKKDAQPSQQLSPQTQQQQQQQQQPFQQSQQQDLQQIWQMQQAQLRARISGAMEQLKTACADEMRNFCSTVTPGEGRLLLCMQAHEDKISRQCELSLLETSRNIGNAVSNVQNFAQACWNDIQVYCSGAGGSIAQCVVDNRSSLSPQCQAMIAAAVPGIRPGQAQQWQPTMSMAGLPIHSVDGTMLGHVTGVRRRPDGGLEAIEADLGSPLGLGATSVLINPGELRWTGDRVELQMGAEQVRSILQGQRR